MTDDTKHHPTPTPTPAPPETEFEKETRLQKEDWEKAVVEEREANERMTALPDPFTEVFQYIGIGPLAYETRRGFVKVLSGDVVCKFVYEDPNVPGVEQTEVVILNMVALEALQAANITDPPVGLSARAARITGKRHEVPKPTNPIVKPELGKPLVGQGVPKPTQLPAK